MSRLLQPRTSYARHDLLVCPACGDPVALERAVRRYLCTAKDQWFERVSRMAPLRPFTPSLKLPPMPIEVFPDDGPEPVDDGGPTVRTTEF